MARKSLYLALRMTIEPVGTINGVACKISLDDGVVGLMSVFRTKADARKAYGRNVKLVEIYDPTDESEATNGEG